MNRRKGVPCGCDADPCGCSPKAHCIKAINNVSPDPNGDLNIKAGAGISISQTGDDEITITNAATPSAFVEGTNIEFTPSGSDVAINVVDDPVFSGDVTVNGETVLNDDLTVNGDIIQNGAAYETHAEKIYSQNDYIVMRDGAVSALPSGDFSGFQVKKYDGTNDGRLVIDNAGVARVGDVGDEQPLMTRSESGSLTNGNLLQWNGTTQKAVDAGVNTSQIVRGSGNIGSDTKPIKVVNGVATAVTNDLVPIAQAQTINAGGYGFGLIISGKIYMTVPINLAGRTVTAFTGQIIARKADADIASYANVSLTATTNAIGQAQFFNQQLPGASGTYQDVTFQCDGNWTIA